MDVTVDTHFKAPILRTPQWEDSFLYFLFAQSASCVGIPAPTVIGIPWSFRKGNHDTFATDLIAKRTSGTGNSENMSGGLRLHDLAPGV